MITAYIALGVLLGLPLLLGLVFRVSASHLFFSVMAGELLGRYFHHEVGSIAKSAFKSQNVAEYAETGILVLPLVLTAVFLMGTLSRGKAVLHMLPYAITGIVLASFALPILPGAVQSEVRRIPIGAQLLDASSMIIGGVVLLQLIALWLLTRNEHHHKKKHAR